MDLLLLSTVCVLVGSAYAQSGMITYGDQILNATRPFSEADALFSTQAAYDSDNATTARRNHFFCVDRDTFNSSTGVLVQFNTFQQNNESVLSIWIQYPLLAYLDVQRKAMLMQAITEVLNSQSSGTMINVNDLCLGTYEVYGITTFNEGVMIRIYHRDLTANFNGSDLAEQFRSNFNGMLSMNSVVTTYPLQSNVRALNLSAVMNFNLTGALHPGSESSDGADPTLLAVIIGVYGGNVTIADVRPMFSFANNPNPINYYLEAGDYVFTVIGSILVALVLFLIIYGYCIDPFI